MNCDHAASVLFVVLSPSMFDVHLLYVLVWRFPTNLYIERGCFIYPPVDQQVVLIDMYIYTYDYTSYYTYYDI